MRRTTALASLLLALALGGTAGAEVPVIGGPCEGCELVFEGMPDEIDSETRIAPVDEAGETLVIAGRVTNRQGEPEPGIIVYAYHTDARGIYPDGETEHGSLRGWARTDVAGRYEFSTIRPASYPDSRVPQHVHMHVIEPGRATYFIDSLTFTDDPHVRRSSPRENARGGSGLATPEKRAGTWFVQRDIVLGENVPGYDELGPGR